MLTRTSLILITSSIKIPKSAHDTKIILDGVMSEVNCAMNYINNFVNPDANLVQTQIKILLIKQL